ALLPIAFYTFAGAYSYRRTFAEVGLWLDGTARVTQEHASKVFQINEVLIGRVFDALRDDDDHAIRARESQLHLHLREMAHGIDHLGDIRIWDGEGRLLASSRNHPVAEERLGEPWLLRRGTGSRGGEP